MNIATFGRRVDIYTKADLGQMGIMMDAPKRLKGDSLRHWKKLQPLLSTTISVLDTEALALFCEALADYTEAREVLTTTGRYIQIGTNGAMQLHPAVSVVKNASDTMLKLSRRLGLDPESRQKLIGTKAAIGEDDDMKALLEG